MRFLPNFFFGIVVLVGVVIAGYGLHVLYRAQRSAGWPSARGVITRSEMVSDRDGLYAPAVEYAYTVAGVRYEGTDITSIKFRSSGGAYARACVAHYQVGAPVVVYYDPQEPTVAVLEPGITKKTFIPLVFGVGIAFFGAWFRLILLWLLDSKKESVLLRFGVCFASFGAWLRLLWWLFER